MLYSLLHINIEKKNHLTEIRDCIEREDPDFVCMEEVFEDDLQDFAKEFNYHAIHAAKFISQKLKDGEGQGILSKYPFVEVNKERYDPHSQEQAPEFDMSVFGESKPKRPQEQFLFNETLLSGKVQLGEKELTVATTHFPVADYTSPGLDDHELSDVDSLHCLEGFRAYFDTFISEIKELPSPLIFTSDLNNARGDYIYTALAHELVDQIPQEVTSSIDPELHRVKKLELMVDTIMTSADVKVHGVKVIEQISDHKGFLIKFSI